MYNQARLGNAAVTINPNLQVLTKYTASANGLSQHSILRLIGLSGEGSLDICPSALKHLSLEVTPVSSALLLIDKGKLHGHTHL